MGVPVNAKGEGPVPSGGNGNSGTSPHPSTYSFPRVAAWALWMLAQPARGGGENRCKAAPRLLRAPGLGSHKMNTTLPLSPPGVVSEAPHPIMILQVKASS